MRRRRVVKPRPAVRVKVKFAKREARCTACSYTIHIGDETTYVTHRIRRYHMTCVPANGFDTPTVSAAPPPLSKDPKVAALAAMEALENALVLRAKVNGITPEMEESFRRYNKLKALSMNPAAFDNEAAIAFRCAISRIVQLVF